MNEEKDFQTQEENNEEQFNIEQENDNQVAKLQEQLNEANDRYLRQLAEFDNYRKRVAREAIDRERNASESLITDLLEVLDDSKRAEEQMDKSKDLEAYKQGVFLIFQKLQKILNTKGLEEMKTIGEDFDPELHEAITEIPAPTPDLSGKIVDQVTTGYKLNDKIIRHAKVVVGK